MLRISLITFLLTGCAATSKLDNARDLPDDLTIDFSILVDPQVAVEAGIEPQRVELRPMRFILWPDGRLNFNDAPEKGPQTVPQEVRKLTRQEMLDLWREIKKIDLSSVQVQVSPMSKELEAPLGKQLMRLVILENKKRSCYIDTFELSQSSRSTLAQIARLFAYYSWATDETPSSYRPPPIRFDVGDDPYQIFK